MVGRILTEEQDVLDWTASNLVDFEVKSFSGGFSDLWGCFISLDRGLGFSCAVSKVRFFACLSSCEAGISPNAFLFIHARKTDWG